MRSVLAIAAVFLLAEGTSGATTILLRSPEQLVADSDVVGVATLHDIHAERGGGTISTHATATFSENIKGGPLVSVEVIVPGGRVGRWEQQVEGAPSMTEGQSVIVFLRRTGSFYQFTGLEQGRLVIEADPVHAGSSVARHDWTAHFVQRDANGGLRDATALPQTEPLEPLLRRLRQLASGRP